jgi:tRNA (adenine22-N1)-methyltransferase
MPKLDVRLKAVAKQIRANTHADIGSDHAHLLLAMLRSGRISRGIAIENKRQPFLNSVNVLAEVDAEVRFGDGLSMLNEGEADSMSICGMGAKSIVSILDKYPSRIPPQMIVQPNHEPELLRSWCLDHHFRLVQEQIAKGHWPYHVLRFQRSKAESDPAYDDVDREAAMLFGPLLIKNRDLQLRLQLEEERVYFGGIGQLTDIARRRLEIIDQLLSGEFSEH